VGIVTRIRSPWSPRWRSCATSNHTAAQKGDALAVLRGCVTLVRHPYERSPYSGAGNCWCGYDPANRLHRVIIEPGAP
jgi:hypothetical protein